MTHDTAFLDDLELDGEVSRGRSDRGNHAGDFGTTPGDEVEPDAVVYAESTADVAAVLRAANDRGVPVTPFAAGTGFEQSATPIAGGVSLDTTRMDAILDVRPDDLHVDVQPGVIGDDVDEAVAKHGLFFPPLPSSGDISTVGGMIATDASGMQTVKYGKVGDWVLEVEAVLADGSVIEAGSKAKKSSSGYNLKDLVVGSEGTLAVITRATLELAGIPEQIRGGRAIFADLEDATSAISDAITSGVDVAKIELVGAETAEVVNAYSGTDLPDVPMVFVEFHANHGIEEEIAFCRSIFEAHDVEAFEIASDERMAELWEAREDVALAASEYDPDRELSQPGDITVPVSKYPDAIRAVKAIGQEYDLTIRCQGHAGDGNLHYFVLVDRDDPDHVRRTEQAYAEIVERAIELGGTATGEHGIGVGKKKYLVPEHGEAGVRAMRSIKQALDPNGILNPGKVVLTDEEIREYATGSRSRDAERPE